MQIKIMQKAMGCCTTQLYMHTKDKGSRTRVHGYTIQVQTTEIGDSHPCNSANM